MIVSVVGLGKVGVSLASCLVRAGHTVIGVDVDGNIVESLNNGRFDTPEPGVVERLSDASPDLFTATRDLTRAVSDADTTFIVVPTPSNTLGGFSLRFVLAACDEIGAAMRLKQSRHTVAVVSTMLPGSSDMLVIPRLEQASGKYVKRDFGYAYNPSFIALGEVVNDIERPDYVLIGESDAQTGDTILEIHSSMVITKSPIARMSPVEAEITKIASNAHETMRVSFANMLLSICSEVPRANVDRITNALAHRMGPRFFKGAVPYGGPCWPRDNQAFSAFIDVVGTPSVLPRAVDAFNDEHGSYVLGKILALTNAGDTVGLLGLTYKPGAPVVERSFGIDLAGWLVQEGRQVIGWDPMAMSQARRVLGDRIMFSETAEDCIRASSLSVITIPLAELEKIDWSVAGATTLLDCWRCAPVDAAERASRYVALGCGPASDVATWLENKAGDHYRQLAG
jgi:UDPglucose 6-dehydrogenase